MNRSTARWTTAFAAAAFIGVPATGWSQTPATSQPPAAQQPAGVQEKQGAAAEHIRLAEAALNDIPTSTLPSRAKSRTAELKRHLNALEKAATQAEAPSATGAKSSGKAKSDWGSEVAAADKILTELLGPASSSPTGATGTAGSTTQSKAATLSLDETTKTKLLEIREHVTAFAASMSGAGSSTPGASPEPAADPAAAAAPAPAASPAPSAESSAPAASGASASSSSAASPSAQAPAEQAQAPAAAANPQVDEEAAKRHLTSARDSLSQLTQLPAAAQLAGDARTQVAQLITNFNELISAQSNWRAAYDKVDANVNALIGAESAPEPAAPPPTGTPGAVGTAGAASGALDPAIRGKLVEFRTHLMQFEKAAGTDASSSSAASPAASTTPSEAPPSSAAPSNASPSTAASASPSSASSPSSPPSDPPATTPEQSAAQAQGSSQMSQPSPLRHIEAIEAILGVQSSATASSPSGAPRSTGTAGGSGSPLTLDRAQIEQIRTHLAELRKAVEKK